MTSYQTAAARPPSGRWLQLLIGIVCMVMIANLQYGWTLFVGPIGQKHGWDRASIQVAFTIFVLTETWLVPIEGWFVDRYGPKIVVVIGGVLPETGVTYYDVPQSFGIMPYRYTVVNGQTVLVEPRSRRIVQVVE